MKMVTVILILSLSCFSSLLHARSETRDVADAVERGDAASYQQLVEVISRQFHGRIIRVELEQEWRNWYYELRLLQDDGRIVEIELEAKSLTILEIEGKNLETVIRQKP